MPSSLPAPAATPARTEQQAHAPASTKPRLQPLGPARYKLQLTAGQQLHDKLQQARDLMRHELPGGDLAEIVDKALDLLIADRMKRRFGLGRKPRVRAQQKQRESKPGSRHIPVEVRRQVVARDGLRCTFVSADGRRVSPSCTVLARPEPVLGALLSQQRTVDVFVLRCDGSP